MGGCAECGGIRRTPAASRQQVRTSELFTELFTWAVELRYGKWMMNETMPVSSQQLITPKLACSG